MNLSPEIITAWAGSIAAAIGVVGVALQKAGVLTLHSRKNKPKKEHPVCPTTGKPCVEHPLVEKRVTDLEKEVIDIRLLLAQISTDVAYIRGKLDSK